MKKTLIVIILTIFALSNVGFATLIRQPITTISIQTNSGSTVGTTSPSVTTQNFTSNFDTSSKFEVTFTDFQNVKNQVKDLIKFNEELKKQIESLKKQNDLSTKKIIEGSKLTLALEKKISNLATEVGVYKSLLFTLDKAFMSLKKKFEDHTHFLNGFTAEGAGTVEGGNKNLIYLNRSNKITQEKREKLKTTGKIIPESGN